MRKFQLKKKSDDKAELLIYEDIGSGWFGGITAKQVAEELNKAKDVREINVRLNSSGGDVFEGVAIYNALRRHPATITVDVDGAALSIASVIAMAADPGELRMAESAFMMIHDPWSITLGGSEDHRHAAELLDGIKQQIVQIYNHRTGLKHDELAEMMAAETWLDSSEAERLKFSDTTTGWLAVAAHVNPKIIHELPGKVQDAIRSQEEEMNTRLDIKNRLDRWTKPRQ